MTYLKLVSKVSKLQNIVCLPSSAAMLFHIALELTHMSSLQLLPEKYILHRKISINLKHKKHFIDVKCGLGSHARSSVLEGIGPTWPDSGPSWSWYWAELVSGPS